MPPSENNLSDDLIHYRRLLDALQDGVYFVDTDRRILYWNDAAERVSGYPGSEVIGKRCMDNLLVHVDQEGRQLCLGMCPLAATIQDGEHRVASVYLHRKDGSRRPVSVRTARVTDAEGNILGGVEIFSDNSAAMAVIERIKHLESMAYLDSLTGLPNRRYVEIALRDRLGEMQR